MSTHPTAIDRPKLRRVAARRVVQDGKTWIRIEDPHGLFAPHLIAPEGYFGLLQHCDGRNSLEEIRRKMSAQVGRPVPMGEVLDFCTQLDRSMVLDGAAYRSFLDGYRAESIRPPAFSGRSYDADVSNLVRRLDGFYNGTRGAGHASLPEARGKLRAVLSPHIDFQRGGHAYTFAYKALRERIGDEVDTFVILGVAHQGTAHRFAVTRKAFRTPLGTAPTDQECVDHLLSRAGSHLLDDELSHRTEHSIEFQVVFLQHALGARPFRIVPILVGSFHDLLGRGIDPIDDPDVAGFVSALMEAESARPNRVAYIGGIDLCHVGPEFGDPGPVTAEFREQIGQFDGTLLDRAADGDPRGWFETAARVNDRWRVCGLSATYTLLHAVGPVKGTKLAYDQAVDPAGDCCVTFASMALEAV
ncbi:MAG: AmmeMemoRadiSam system protein B [Isosphaeraceae bacterium]